jgi:hypothetical protein
MDPLVLLEKCQKSKKRICINVDQDVKVIGQFEHDGKFKLLLYGYGNQVTSWNKQCSRDHPEIDKLYKNTMKELLKNLMKIKCDHIRLKCQIGEKTWTDVNVELENAGKIDFKWVAEDKRSGLNLIQYTRIGEKLVDHNPWNEACQLSCKTSFRKDIDRLYSEMKSVQRCRRSVLYCIWAQILSKDMSILVAKALWTTRSQPCWTIENEVENLMHETIEAIIK